MCIDASISDCNEIVGNSESQDVIGYKENCTGIESMVAGNISDSSVIVGVSEVNDFADHLDNNTSSDIVEEIYTRPGICIPGAFFNPCRFVEL